MVARSAPGTARVSSATRDDCCNSASMELSRREVLAGAAAATVAAAVPSAGCCPMSYDILVFNPAHAPSGREAFLEWWDRQRDWSEPHPYNDSAFTTPKLRAWFFDMIERFPALNGPHAASRDQRSADYCRSFSLPG